jgi:Mrp family chromosome partitioning ATPase
MFRGPSAPGLTDYFTNAAELDQILYCDTRTGVNYVPVGVASPRPGIITTDRLRLLIARLSKRYKYIILDSAPLLAVSETSLLSQLAQKTILVVKWDSTPLELARDAVTELLGSGADIAIALSMVDMRRAAKYGDPRAAAYKRLKNYYGYKRTAE